MSKSKAQTITDEIAALTQENHELFDRLEAIEGEIAEQWNDDNEALELEYNRITTRLKAGNKRMSLLESQLNAAQIEDAKIDFKSRCKAAAQARDKADKINTQINELTAKLEAIKPDLIAAQNEARRLQGKLPSWLRTKQDELQIGDLKPFYEIHDKHNLESQIRYWSDHPVAIEYKRRQDELKKNREREAAERAAKDREIWLAKSVQNGGEYE